MKKVFIVFSILLFIYMLWPEPQSINSFAPLPQSEKSTLSGDTWQIPNVAGYYSNNYRDFVVPFYSKMYQKLSFFIFPPVRINYPPEYAFVAIKKHTDSTYLEELVYPLRDSFYINGFEPFYQDGEPKYWGAAKFNLNSTFWDTKVTVRFYPSSTGTRFIVWLGIIISIGLIYRLTRKIII